MVGGEMSVYNDPEKPHYCSVEHYFSAEHCHKSSSEYHCCRLGHMHASVKNMNYKERLQHLGEKRLSQPPQ